MIRRPPSPKRTDTLFPDTTLFRSIVNAMEGANRAASLTQRLLAFARQQPLQPEGVAVGPLILGMSEMLSRTLGEQIEMEMRSEEHTSELQSLMRISYAVFCLKRKKRSTT